MLENGMDAARPRVSRLRFALRAAAQRHLSNGGWADALSLAFLAGLSCVMVVTLDDYGLTYDEEPHIRYGERVLEYYASGFRSAAGVSRSSYGATFDVVAALLRRVSPWDAYRTNHILCAFVAQIGLLGTWRLGRLIAGPQGGLSALLFLVLTPVYYGHQFNNPKDIPFAAGYVWGLYFIARLVITLSPGPAHSPRDALLQLGGWRYWAALAVALGLGMSVRVGGAVLVGYLVLFLGLVSLDGWRRSSRAEALAVGPFWVRSLLAIGGGWALLIAAWPRALANPLDGPSSALATVSKYTAYDSPTLLAGKIVPSQEVPWNYLPTYFAIQLPEFTTLCFVVCCGVVLAIGGVALRRGRDMPWAWLLLIVSVVLPPLYAIVRHSTLYNGLRHFLFIIPPIAVLAGAGLSELGRWAARRHRLGGVAVAGLLGLFTLDQAMALWRLHPHEHAFFNRASGGLANAIDRYETEYYGSVYKELLARLTEQVWVDRPEEYLNRTFLVAGCGSNLFFKQNLPANFRYAPMRAVQTADYYATYARDGCLKRHRDRALVTTVTRDSATLGVARDMKRRAKRTAEGTPRSER
jgi:hypothetical protein